MVIVGLLSVGVALALDKYAERQALKKNQDSEGGSESHGGSDHETGNVRNTDLDREKQELAAFNELQNYANFQSDLSTRVLDDISRDQFYLNDATQPPTDDLRLTSPTQEFNRFEYGSLRISVIIQQQEDSFGTHFWSRDYDPVLQQCGVTHQTFLEFIDSFNQYVTLSPELDVVNLAALPSSFGDERVASYSHTVISEAAQVLKAAQMRGRNDTAIEQLNAAFLSPHGLFAMVVSSRPSDPSQIISVASQQPHPPTRTPSWSSPNKRTRVLSPNSTFRMETQRKSSTSSSFQPSMHDPHHNSFTSLISTVMKHRESNTRRRRVRGRSFSRGMNGSITHSHFDIPSRTRQLAAEEDVGLASINNGHLEVGALYLIITNDPNMYSISAKESDISTGLGKGKQPQWAKTIDPQLLQQQQEYHNYDYGRGGPVKSQGEAPPAYSRIIEKGYGKEEDGWR